MTDRRLSPFQRFMLPKVRRFGWDWVGDNERAVIYRQGRFHRITGPGFFHYDPVTETLYGKLSLLPDLIVTDFNNVQTKDGNTVGLKLHIRYCIDAEASDIPREKMGMLLDLPRDMRRAAVTDFAQQALQAIVSRFNVPELARAQVFQAIERQLHTTLTDALKKLAIRLENILLLWPQLPAELQAVFAQTARRAIEIEDADKYEPYQLTNLARVKLAEALEKMSPARQYINLTDFTGLTEETYPARGRMIAQEPAQILPPESPPDVIDHDEDAPPPPAPPDPPRDRPRSKL